VICFLIPYRVAAECKNFVFAGDLPAVLGTGRRSRHLLGNVLGENRIFALRILYEFKNLATSSYKTTWQKGRKTWKGRKGWKGGKDLPSLPFHARLQDIYTSTKIALLVTTI
jgi:hypothetical protein